MELQAGAARAAGARRGRPGGLRPLPCALAGRRAPVPVRAPRGRERNPRLALGLRATVQPAVFGATDPRRFLGRIKEPLIAGPFRASARRLVYMTTQPTPYREHFTLMDA